MTSIKNTLKSIISTICISLFILITLIGVWQVAARFIFNNPAAWTEETLTYGFTWLALLSFAVVASNREHMRLTFVIEKLDPPTKLIVEIFTEVALIAFSTAVFIYGGVTIMKLTMMQITPALQMPMGVFYGVLPITGVLLDLFCLINIAELLSGKVLTAPETETAKES